MKQILIVLLLFTVNIYSQNEKKRNQKGIIKGIVVTQANVPLELVNVLLEGTSSGSTTNSEGEYYIVGIDPGNYILTVSFIGFKTNKTKIQVKEGVNDIPKIILQPVTQELGEVLVEDNKINKFANEESEYIAKLPIKNMENPQSYSSVSKVLLKEQNITDYSLAVRTIPGAAISSQNGVGLFGTYVRGFLTYSYIRNGLYILSPSGEDPQVIERLEIIKGPSGAVYGSAGVNYGGLINKVTKKPFSQNYFNAGFTFGSYDLQRFTADINLPVDKEKKFLFRLNSAVHTDGSFQDYGKEKNYLIAPSFSYKLSNDLDFLFEAEIYSMSNSAQTFFNGVSNLDINSIDQINTDYYSSYSSGNIMNPPTTLINYYSSLNYKISREWKLNTSFGISNVSLIGTVIIPNFISNTMMVRQFYDFNGEYNTLNIQSNLNGEFYIGNFKNRFLAGLNYINAGASVLRQVVFSADTINYTIHSNPLLNIQQIRSDYDFKSYYFEIANAYSLYVSDAIDLTKKINLLLSLRYSYYDNKGRKEITTGLINPPAYSQDNISPQAGITYQLIENKLSFFANYMQGFNFVPPNSQGQSFKPEFAVQFEGGVKLNILNEKFTSNLSYYNIKVKDKIRIDRQNPLLSIQDGTQLSEGIDVDIRANPIIGLNILLGYSYNESKFTKSDQNIEGKRPIGTPKNIFNFWSSYTFNEIVNGLGIGIGIIYSSDYFYDDANSLSIPSYALLKSSLFYDSSKFRISFTGENLTNQKYWDYNGTPQMLRRILFSLNIII